MAEPIYHLRLPSLIIFGNGAAESITDVLRDLGVSRPLIVTDPDLHRTGLVTAIERRLRSGGLSVGLWSEAEKEPSSGSVDYGVETARSTDRDAVIGIGGGSVLDSAKAIAMLVVNGGRLETYFGSGNVGRRGLPTILVPTTAGTGSEVTANALFRVEAEQVKKAIISPHLIPNVALVDPVLTLSLPADVTAGTGFDALCHAIESYTGRNSSPLVDGLALEAIELIGGNLRQAVHKGSLLVPRQAMAQASLFAGMCICGAGTNAVHALAYPLQGIFRIPHSIANAVLLPHVMEFNIVAEPRRFATVAARLGPVLGSQSSEEVAQAGVRACRQLAQDVGIPQRLRSLGVRAEQIPELVSAALEVTRLLANSPRPIGLAEATAIYEAAL